MKRFATETSYFLNRVIFGFLFVPGILWACRELIAMYFTGTHGVSLSDTYVQFYSRLDSPVTWMWVLSPYMVFLLVRPRSRPVNMRYHESVTRPVAKNTDNPGLDIHGQTPLHLAAMIDNVAIVHMLADGGANIEAVDFGNGARPLHNAAVKGCVNVCAFLINRGADIDAQTAAGDTALHLAAANRHFDVVSLLLRHHADTGICNNAGFSAGQFAIASGYSYSTVDEAVQQHTGNDWHYSRMTGSGDR
jgi:hypothetical protein